MEATNHKCPACSATLPFDPETQTWKCEYCAGTYTIEDLEKYEKKEDNKGIDEKETMKVHGYECSSCGAKIIVDENTAATSCVYCRNTAIMKDRLTGVLKPSYVIPFKKTKDDAILAFKNFRKGKFFAPKDFMLEENIKEISGIYIPFWLYDFKAHGEINGIARNVRTWRSGDYRYTKTDTYRVGRKGSMEFERVPVDGSKKFDDNYMNSIEPFNYEDLQSFSSSYLSGFLAEKYDVSEEEAVTSAQKRVEETVVAELKNTIKGYDTVGIDNKAINVDKQKSEYVLLPVWMLNLKYKDKIHTFAMNGQTGKFIGNIPINWGKFFLTWLGLFVLISVIIACIGSFVSASTNTYERTESNLQVSDDINVTSKNKKAILATPKVDETEKIYDFANLFTTAEEEKLYDDVNTFIDSYNLDMAIVTIDDNNKTNAKNYADDFYDYNYFGTNSTHDGVLFLIDMDTREMWMSTTGQAQLIYDDVRIDAILDKAYATISNQKYYECANKFIYYSGYYAEKGIPSSNKNATINDKGDYIYGGETSSSWSDLLTVLIIAAISSGVIVLLMTIPHKTVTKASFARQYLEKETFKLGKCEDYFLDTHTSRIYIGSSSSGGRSGGGSSTHSSSSGRSHGGGGRRF